MRRDARAFLADVLEACDLVAGFVGGRDLESYRSDVMLRSATERQLEIMGEALNRLARSPTLGSQLASRTWRPSSGFAACWLTATT